VLELIISYHVKVKPWYPNIINAGCSGDILHSIASETQWDLKLLKPFTEMNGMDYHSFSQRMICELCLIPGYVFISFSESRDACLELIEANKDYDFGWRREFIPIAWDFSNGYIFVDGIGRIGRLFDGDIIYRFDSYEKFIFEIVKKINGGGFIMGAKGEIMYIREHDQII